MKYFKCVGVLVAVLCFAGVAKGGESIDGLELLKNFEDRIHINTKYDLTGDNAPFMEVLIFEKVEGALSDVQFIVRNKEGKLLCVIYPRKQPSGNQWAKSLYLISFGGELIEQDTDIELVINNEEERRITLSVADLIKLNQEKDKGKSSPSGE